MKRSLTLLLLLIAIAWQTTNNLYAQSQEESPTLQPGDTAPAFRLSTIDGQKIALTDLKGKIIYLDFWASWCRPCVAEIPASRKLQERYKNNPEIVFINISFDDDTLQWQRTVQSKKMSGIQLISPQGKVSNVLKNYGVWTIPKFYIIDKNGLIVDADAPRPSEKGLEEYLDRLIKSENPNNQQE